MTDNIKKIYKGVFVPMISPFTDQGKIDVSKSEKLLQYILDNNCNPFILGTTGEGGCIPMKERMNLVDLLIENRHDGVPCVACVLALTFQDTIATANEYLRLGIDAVTITLPNYYPLNDIQIFEYLNKLTSGIQGNVILYNIPKTVHMSIPLEIIEKLSHRKNIIGIKDSEFDENRLNASLKLWKDREDFFFLVGVNALMLQGLSSGASGIVPSTANFATDTYYRMYAYCVMGDFEKAELLFKEGINLSNIYQKDRNLTDSIAALKYLVSRMGLCEKYVLPPLLEISKEESIMMDRSITRLLKSNII